jgi:hypothetical protein
MCFLIFFKIYQFCIKILSTKNNENFLTLVKTTKICKIRESKWCSAMRSAVRFQKIPHKQNNSILIHVKTTIQVRNGHNG